MSFSNDFGRLHRHAVGAAVRRAMGYEAPGVGARRVTAELRGDGGPQAEKKGLLCVVLVFGRA